MERSTHCNLVRVVPVVYTISNVWPLVMSVEINMLGQVITQGQTGGTWSAAKAQREESPWMVDCKSVRPLKAYARMEYKQNAQIGFPCWGWLANVWVPVCAILQQQPPRPVGDLLVNLLITTSFLSTWKKISLTYSCQWYHWKCYTFVVNAAAKTRRRF